MKKLSALLVLLAATSAFAQTSGTPAPASTPGTVIKLMPALPAPLPAPQIDSGIVDSPGARPLVISNEDGQQNMQEVPREWHGSINQDGCPVKLTSASLAPYLMFLNTASNAPTTQSGVDLQFRNNSGKPIQSFELDAVFLARRTIYDLRATRITLHLTAEGTRALDKTFDHLRRLPLPSRTHPITLNEVRLAQVTFTDGSTWTADNSACSIAPNGSLEIGSR